VKITPKLAILAAATAFVATPALANGHQAPTSSASVEIADLDLNTQTDRDTLDRRVSQAIRSLCNTNDRAVSAQRRATQCRLAARASAQPQVRFAILEAKGPALALNAQAIEISEPRG
jgi:UrcA family protein